MTKAGRRTKEDKAEIVVTRERQVARAIRDLEIAIGMAFHLFRKRVSNIFEPGSVPGIPEAPPEPPNGTALPLDPDATDIDPRFFKGVIAGEPHARRRKRRGQPNGQPEAVLHGLVATPERAVRIAPAASSAEPSEPLGLYARKILGVLVRFGRPCSTTFVAIVLGRSESGSFDVAVAELRRHGYVDGDRSALRVVRAPEPSLRLDVAPLPTGLELLHMWTAKLEPCPAAILQTLYDHHPRALMVEDLAQLSRKPNGEPYSVSGSFDVAVAKLKKLELIDGKSTGLRLHEVFAEAAGANARNGRAR